MLVHSCRLREEHSEKVLQKRLEHLDRLSGKISEHSIESREESSKAAAEEKNRLEALTAFSDSVIRKTNDHFRAQVGPCGFLSLCAQSSAKNSTRCISVIG